VTAALDAAEAALRADDPPAADAALARAGARLGDGGPDDLRERLADLTRDRDMVEALEFLADRHKTTRREALGLEENKYGRVLVEPVFHRYGLDLLAGEPAAMADRVNRSPIRSSLVTGLDAALPYFGPGRSSVPRPLLDLLRRLDGDPARNQVREAWAAQDAPRLCELVRAFDPDRLTPGFAAAVGDMGDLLSNSDRLRILTPARDRYPGDYRLNAMTSYRSAGEAENNPTPDAIAASVANARIVVALRPAFPWNYYFLGNTLSQAGDLSGAIAAYRRFLELMPDDGTNGFTVADISYQVGDLVRKLSGPEAALRHFRGEVERSPASPLAHYTLGRALREAGDPDEALASFRRAAELGPRHRARSYGMIGHVLFKKGDLDGALAAYRTAVAAADRKHPDVHSEARGYTDQIVIILARQHKFREALRGVEQLLADPSLDSDDSSWHAYSAGCLAVLAGTIGGVDPYPAAEWPALRRKALKWLRQRLDYEREFLSRPQTSSLTWTRAKVHRWTQHYLTDPDLPFVRHPLAVALLPADEREGWRKLWADVRRLRDETAPVELAPPPRPVQGKNGPPGPGERGAPAP
jgi:tetratricopeptide (TPR) repeat protein